MKRVYLFFALLFVIGTSAFAQVDLEMVSRSVGTSPTSQQPITNATKLLIDGDHPKDLYFAWSIKLKSGAPLAVGDTIGVLMKGLGTVPWTVVSSVKNVGDTVNFVAKTFIGPDPHLTNSTTSNVSWCDTLLFKRKNSAVLNVDPTPGNDRLCNTISMVVWVTGIQNVNTANVPLSVYPNPATDKLTLKYNFENAAAKVAVRDILGKVVYEKALGSNISGEKEYTIDITHLQPGIYVVELTANDVKSIAKVIVQ